MTRVTESHTYVILGIISYTAKFYNAFFILFCYQWLKVSHPSCPTGRYTGQVIFRRQGIEAVPDGNGTFTCVQQEEGSDSGQVSRRGVSIGQDSGVFQSYTGAWETGLRNGLGVTNYKNGDIYTGPYVNDKRQGLGEALIDYL